MAVAVFQIPKATAFFWCQGVYCSGNGMLSPFFLPTPQAKE
jgi:hypothetical protein